MARCVYVTGGPLHDAAYLTAADLAGLRQSASSPDSSPMAAMLRDGAGHFGPPPPTGPPPPHALAATPFSRYSGLRHPGPGAGPQQTQLPPNSQSGPPQPAPGVEVAAEIW